MKKFRAAIGISVLAIAVSVTGCSKGKEATPSGSAADTTVLAKINSETITIADFKQQVSELAPQMQQAVVSDPKARKEFLDDLIGIALVVQEAKKQGMDKDAAYTKHLETVKKEVERRVREDARNELFNNLLKKEIGDKMNKVPEPTAQEVSEYYDKNKEKLRTADGKQIALKDIEPQLKARMMQEKRREVYIDYSKSLKSKAKISIDEKALASSTASLGHPGIDLSGMSATKAPAAEEAKEEPKK